MTATKVARLTVSVAAVLTIGASTTAPIALAQPDPDVPPAPAPAADVQPQPEFGPGPHNVIYRARVDGVSRGASITYKLSDTEFNTADPTMVPGRMFEATGVVTDPQNAGMQVSIQWPYTASLHCEILVDDQVVAQADQFVAPRFTPQRNDPGYGILSCGTVTNFPTGNTEPVDAPLPADVPPAEPAPPVVTAPPA
ncbi:hypothetical protein [Mycolicibacterium arenosum]|uniref:Uncharacterized protein n=1 Tax=Mycolicibacterium arenosum TaxID=2952157 RepID=A0ABT1M0B2_9MYCO|nr:hypothetical protein [Mycolicibacterium sp. CAU 1645]MCP9272590.1 hypothetical protein [Mycolicibacterium sp. CAU 1645]